MKRLLVLLAVLLPLAAAAQPASTIKDAMNRIEKTFGVYFVHSADLPVGEPTAFRIDPEGNLQKNLRDLFGATGIIWYVKQKYVVLTDCCATLRPAPVWPEPTARFRVDTLMEAVKTALLTMDRYETGGYQVDPLQIRRVVTPLGEGDAFKYVQQLPGISMGGEGGTAIHVRGSNMGSNLVTLDDVPIYGLSHLMGLASVLPGDVIGTSEFRAGGFHADESNLTASHLRLQSYNGDFERTRARFSVNPFLLSASVSTPIEKGASSFIGSARISPIGLEYKALRNLINPHLGEYSDFGATVGDLYGKFTWRRDARSETALSLFGSLDQYTFGYEENSSSEQLSWSNLMANLSWKKRRMLGFDEIHTALSFTDHMWRNRRVEQTGYDPYASHSSDYRSSSRLDEISFRSTACKRYDRWTFQAGLKVSGARFNPEASLSYYKKLRNRTGSRIDHVIYTLLPTVYGEAGYEIPEKLEVRLALRANAYFAWQKEAEFDPGENRMKEPERTHFFHPEANLSARVNLLPQLGIEGTFDYLTQYYHYLEEVSLGWSLDPVVPAMSAAPPERSLQGYLGLFGSVERHSFRAGGFYKQMYDIVYYLKMTQPYNGSHGTYSSLLIGDGYAYGAEFLYEKEGPDLSWKLAYTWSKSERIFEKVNGGEPIPARYDRRHILNAHACWKGLTATFTLQSGHRETVAAQQYTGGAAFIDEERLIGYEPYNVQVPALIRLDVGYQFTFRSGRDRSHPLNHNLTIGIYNVLNRHNPSVLLFDLSTREWKYISFFPIMPSIRYILEL